MGRHEAPARAGRVWPPTQYITRNSKLTLALAPDLPTPERLRSRLRWFSPEELVEGGRVPRLPVPDDLAVGKVKENHLPKIDGLSGRRPRSRLPVVEDPQMCGGKVGVGRHDVSLGDERVHVVVKVGQ